ncbi:MAG: glycoside hydrolase family 3 protein [Lachnospiraceae bacterium]|nr:glycoside hydrolase family 3 protein [Lachnospiraceae bacterium]
MKIDHWKQFWKIAGLVCLVGFLIGAGKADTLAAQAETEQSATETEQMDTQQTDVKQIVENMTLKEKVAQLFVITPETLTGGGAATKVTSELKSKYKKYPVGGFILMGSNITGVSQIKKLNKALKSMSVNTVGVIPFIAVDEEGGTVARIASKSAFGVKNVGNMSAIGATKKASKAYSAGKYIGTYLAKYGFNVDFAPVADIWSNPSNTVVKYRSFGSSSSLVSKMVGKYVDGLHAAGIASTLKHFPGHGNTTEDSHLGMAVSLRKLSQLRNSELKPFKKGIAKGTEFIMVGHISLPNVTGSNVPATLSKKIVTKILRNELSYDGIVITDAMSMSAITDSYSSGQAAVKAIQAGCDMILAPENFVQAYNAVLSAVRSGKISESRLDKSVTRIVKLKLEMAG